MKTRFVILAALAVLCVSSVMSCTGGVNAKSTEVAISADTLADERPPLLQAVDRFLIDSIGKQYASGDVCIPCVPMTSVDGTDTADIKVWGDFWVFNYNIVGDTLKCVSGGSHSGLMHMRLENGTYVVTAFEQVEDGSRNEPSARRIFGDKYEMYRLVNSDDSIRELTRRQYIIDYVKLNGIKASCYQDYGHPAVNLQ